MGQTANPIANRLGYTKGWQTNWYAKKEDCKKRMQEDYQVRESLIKKLKRLISQIFIERVSDTITVTIHSNKPGLLIGPSGKKVQEIKSMLEKCVQKKVTVNIMETKVDALNATLVAQSIAEQIEARKSYKHAVRRALDDTMRAGAGGIKIRVSGRLGGAEIARPFPQKRGRIPCQTLRADIDYAIDEAVTTYGKIGVQVWIFKHEVYGKRDLTLNIETLNSNKRNR
ncbi:MAG: 30S ribosomal protein S3 [Bacteroidota bacterium]